MFIQKPNKTREHQQKCTIPVLSALWPMINGGDAEHAHTHTRTFRIFFSFPNTKMALYIFFSVFFLELAEKLLFLISMTTSKQGSGLDTAWPAGFLPCNVQHTHAHEQTIH